MKKLVSTLLFLGCFVPVWAEAATYYVATSGRDTNTCTQAQSQSTPRLTVQGGINCMASGDKLEIKAGVYARPTSNPPGGSSFSNPTTIQRFGSDVVTIRGWAPINTSGQQYIILDGLIFDATGMGFNEAVYVDNGAHHIRIVNCEVTGSAGTAGIALYGSGGFHEVLNSRIHHNGASGQFDHGIYVKSAGNLIQGNEIDHNGAAGVHFYNAGTDMGTGNVVTKNLIHDNTTGIVSWNLTNAMISNNVLYGHPTGQGVSANRAPGLKMYNNTITGSGTGIDLSNSTSVVITNNIVHNNTVNINDLGSGTTKDRNLCNSGCAVNANPLFVSSTNLSLQLGSPAIDTGMNLGSILLDDFAGSARPVGASYDIGAYEYGSSLQPPQPPTNVRVIR